MESSPIIAKKLWKIVRIVLLMLRRRISKSKIMLDLHHLMTKRGKMLEKVIGSLMFSTHSALNCQSNDIHPHHHNSNKRIVRKDHHSHNGAVAVSNGLQKVLEMLNDEVVAGSPILPGFGRSPLMVRQLRVTDSPFPLRDVDENSSQVDEQAEEFIQRFYEQLRLQSIMSPLATPSRS
ncbi:hypothetical protein ACHQM5_002042 [Ranunculus cassubicifolius]